MQPGDRLEARVIHIVDGDSLIVELRGLRVAVRLAGINCPEWNELSGKKATEFTKVWIKRNSTVELEAGQDYYNKKPDCWDKYHRLIAFIWRDGEMLQEKLLRSGNAEVKYIRAKNKYYGRLEAPKE